MPTRDSLPQSFQESGKQSVIAPAVGQGFNFMHDMAPKYLSINMIDILRSA